MPGPKIWIEISAPPVPLANSAQHLPTIAVHCQWEDETVRGMTHSTGTSHSPSYAEAKKMELLTLHTQGCPRASSRECSSSSDNF